MWNRQDLKMKGKMAFKNNYWPCVIVAFVLSLLVTAEMKLSRGSSSMQDTMQQMRVSGISTTTLAAIIAGAGVVAIIIAVLIDMFVRNMLIVGGYRFFIRNGEEENASARYLISAYGDGKFVNVFVTMFLRNLFIALWTCLLIVPGIVKSYAYRMVPYILADNPDISPMDAIKLSSEMMDGNKMNAFVLDLSFIGWRLLGAITCELLGIFYVKPYIAATNAELYRTLKK